MSGEAHRYHPCTRDRRKDICGCQIMLMNIMDILMDYISLVGNMNRMPVSLNEGLANAPGI